MRHTIELLEAARGGDEAALDALIARHQAQVYRFAMKMCRDPEDARDVLQETLFALARGVREFRGASSISTWLYAVARSFCIKKRRRSKYAPKVISLELEGEAGAVRDPARSPEEVLAGKQVEAALTQAIGTLVPKYREVLILRDVEGLRASEVAEILDISERAVKSRLHRARVAVRAQLAPLLGFPAQGSSESCPDVLMMFSKHLEDEISADVCRAMERHLNGCTRCKSACDSLKQTLALCSAARHHAGSTDAVPDDVQREVKTALRTYLLSAR